MQRTKNSMRKIKSLVFLMLLTLILAITATYAWFSTQRDIEVSGMRLNVEVAESLQISLDGEIWTQSIQIANMRQFYGTYTGTGDGFAIYQAKKPDEGGNTNYVPTELLPVSSAGEVSGGKLQFVQGTIESNADGTTKLTGITACSESDLTATETVANRQNGNTQHPYLVFDMYLRNISAKTTGLDELLLNAGSAVWVNGGTADDGDQEGAGVAGTGLEYSARVGMVVYGNTISTTATNTADKTIGQQIRELGAKGDEVAAIWEPNNKEHTAYVVANNGRGITSTSQAVDTYGVKVGVASAATKEIANINATNDANLVAVDTFTPAYTTAEAGTTSKTVITNTAGNNLGIAPNQISKVRIYVWLEGQDPDCIDLASTGDKLNVTLKLTKDQTTSTDKNTYTEEVAEPPIDLTPSGTIPEGGTYYVGIAEPWYREYQKNATAIYTEGDAFPATPSTGDIYVYGDYEYGYNKYVFSDGIPWMMKDENMNGWGVLYTNYVKPTPQAFLESINGKPIVNLHETFNYCTNITSAPTIPNNVIDVGYMFRYCSSLTGTIIINANPTEYGNCFDNVDFKAQNITLTGESTMLDEIGATGLNYCAECNGACAENH